MKNFTPGQIKKAYEKADSRVIDAIGTLPIDDVVADLQHEHALAINKIGELRMAIDFVLIGLITAKELSAQIGELFPDHREPIVKKLNETIFKPVLEYVRTHEPLETPPETPPADPFAESDIELSPTEDGQTVPERESSSLDDHEALADAGIVVDEPIPKKPTNQPMPTVDTIQERISEDPVFHVTQLDMPPKKPNTAGHQGASRTYNQDPYQEDPTT